MKAAILYAPHTRWPSRKLRLTSRWRARSCWTVVGAGVCHSDYHYVTGHRTIRKAPAVLGHEGAGTVRAVGPGCGISLPATRSYFRSMRCAAAAATVRMAALRCVSRTDRRRQAASGLTGSRSIMDGRRLSTRRWCRPTPASKCRTIRRWRVHVSSAAGSSPGLARWSTGRRWRRARRWRCLGAAASD